MLHAVGVDASFFDATAVLIAMAVIAQLPVGPSVGAAAVVLILGSGGVAAAAAAGVLLTATGTVGAVLYVTWAALDAAWVRRRAAAPAAPAVPAVPVVPAAPAAVPAAAPAAVAAEPRVATPA
jgi:hypothetical protein